jgi:polyhydroxybutyrate depolymerase
MIFLWSCTPCIDDFPCHIDGGQYHILAPKEKEPQKIWVFFHGWSGSPQQYINQPFIETVIEEEGVLLILPEGKEKTWSMENMGGEDSHRNEEQFLTEILSDVREVWSMEDAPLYLGGFSLGAALSEHLACHTDLDISGVYSISGGFWDPVPLSCGSSLFSVHHVHGLTDGTWPYEGRRVGSGTQAHQENIQELWKREYECSEEIEEEDIGPLSCRSWKGCMAPVSWCLHSEGHRRLDGWFSRMILSMKE